MTEQESSQVRPWIVDQCERYRRHLTAKEVVPESEIVTSWPADDADLKDWVRCYGQMRAWLWQQEDVPTRTQAAEERVLQALQEEPEAVKLSDRRRVEVYPKGLHALLWFRQRDWLVGWLADGLDKFAEAASRGQLDRDEVARPASAILKDASEELSYQLAIMAAVCCTPGPRLPDWVDQTDEPPSRWQPWRKRHRPDPACAFLDMDVVDLLAINRAFREVNAGRLAVLHRIVKPRTNGKSERLSWNVFIGSLAMKLDADPEYLAKDRSLVSLIAQVYLSANTGGDDELEEAFE